jgi:hypothetical protein
MTEASGWIRAGRWLAWVLAVSFLVAAVIFILLEFDVTARPVERPPGPPDLVSELQAFFANEQTRWPQQVAASLLFALGFAALAGIGVLLRDVLGRQDGRTSIVSGSLGMAGVVGVTSQLAWLGAREVAIDGRWCDCKYFIEQIVSQGRTLAMIDGLQEWLLFGVFALAAAGIFLAGRLALERGFPSSGWARYSFIIAALFLVALVGSFFDLELLFAAITGIGGGILLPLWALWLARQLDRAPAPASA